MYPIGSSFHFALVFFLSNLFQNQIWSKKK